MGEAKFTKGEWVARTDSDVGVDVAIVYLSDKGGFDISGAPDCIPNAHLIAAAPEMYALLEEIMLSEASVGKDDGYYDNIKQLLAKARGEV